MGSDELNKGDDGKAKQSRARIGNEIIPRRKTILILETFLSSIFTCDSHVI